MKRELQAFCVGFTWPVVVFLAALAFCVWLTSPVFGDDFDDHLAALKQQNAAAKPATVDCGCKGRRGACKCPKGTCECPACSFADPFAAKNAGGCHCKGDQCYHDCEGVCNDITCPFRPIIDAPAEEMIRASDGRTYPRSAWPGGDPWAGVRQTYYAPVGPADSSPRYHPLVAPRFFGGGAVSCGPSG